MIYTREQLPTKIKSLLDQAIERLEDIVRFKDMVKYLAENHINRVFYTSDPKLTEEEKTMSRHLELVLKERADLRKKLFDCDIQESLEKHLFRI